MAISAAIGLLVTATQARELYIWTDEDGVKHYSNIAPSEATEEFQKKDEIESGAGPANRRPDNPRQTRDRPFRPSAAPAEPDRQTPEADRPVSADDDGRQSAAAAPPALDLKVFPVTQDELIRREKTIVKTLKSKLEDSAVDRETLIEAERRRLLEAIEDLEKAPLNKFGSQKNKQRQVGYYKYRLEEIESDPDTYFEYSDSAYD